MSVSLSAVTAELERIAPTALAAEWDNVGLLIEPARPRAVTSVALTIDLTEPVLDEALAADADVIVAYHPPIFGGLDRLVMTRPATRVLLRAIDAGVAIYSPHTALDAAPGGMSDWLLDGLGAVRDRRPITPAGSDAAAGAGRIGALDAPAPLTSLIRAAKAWLDLEQLRVAAPEDHAAGVPLRTIAVCPGAGGSLFRELSEPPDLLVTGELRHHDVLGHVARGTSVILTDHSNTERGFLPILARRIEAALPGVQTVICRRDRDPLVIR